MKMSEKFFWGNNATDLNKTCSWFARCYASSLWCSSQW